jgi:hypothetical protein
MGRGSTGAEFSGNIYFVKHLQNFSLFESNHSLTEDQISYLNRTVLGPDSIWILDRKTGLVDVAGDFDGPHDKRITELPVQFGKVTGNFLINNCSHLKSLKGAPRTVGGNFDCRSCDLESLVGAPEEVGGYFACSYNELTSLEGGPKKVGGTYICAYNDLKDLKGSPGFVGGEFRADGMNLDSLAGAPKTIKGLFACMGISVPPKDWNPEGMIEILPILQEEKERRMLAELIPAEDLQHKINLNPEKMAMTLKSIWKEISQNPKYKGVNFPEDLKQEVDILSNLDRVGF